MLTEKDLEDINWRATRGSHSAGAFLGGSAYAHEVIDQDVPRLIAETRQQREILDLARLLIQDIARPGIPLSEIRLGKAHAQFNLQECRRFLDEHPNFNQPDVLQINARSTRGSA